MHSWCFLLSCPDVSSIISTFEFFLRKPKMKNGREWKKTSPRNIYKPHTKCNMPQYALRSIYNWIEFECVLQRSARSASDQNHWSVEGIHFTSSVFQIWVFVCAFTFRFAYLNIPWNAIKHFHTKSTYTIRHTKIESADNRLGFVHNASILHAAYSLCTDDWRRLANFLQETLFSLCRQ